MTTARILHLFSTDEARRESLRRLVFDVSHGMPLRSEIMTSFEELRGKLEGGQVDYILLDGRATGRRMLDCLGEPEPDALLGMSLAELEKRHILRVLASTNGNKTRAARILGIDTKTLYNKLKSYQASENARQRRLVASTGA